MKRISVTAVVVLLLAVGSICQQLPAAGRIVASNFNLFSAKLMFDVASGAGKTVTLDNCFIRNTFALATTIPLTFQDSAAETATPSAVSTPVASTSAPNGYTCTATITLSSAHSAGTPITFGDGGLGAAIKSISSGVVVLDPSYTSDTALASITSGKYTVNVEDLRGPGGPATYSWNGSAYVGSSLPMTSVNGAYLVPFVNEELLTLATGSTNSDTTANLLPANSLILAVVGRVQTAITGSCTGWTLADPTTAGRFAASNTTLTAGTTSVGTVHATTGIASATTGIFQSAAAKVRVVCAGGNASAGKIRITVFGYTIAPPAQ